MTQDDWLKLGDKWETTKSKRVILYPSLGKILGDVKGRKILDAGCGDGRLCYELKKEKADIVGIDFSERAISFAKAFNPDVKFMIGDIRKLKLAYKFDSIILMETLEHIPPKDIPSLLDGLYRILGSNGKLIITVPSINLPLSDKHYQHFTEESLRKTLEPYFGIDPIFGYSKKGFKRKVFNNLIRFGLLLFPLKNRIPSIYRFYKFINNYFVKNLMIGKPEECYGLIAICSKKAKK